MSVQELRADIDRTIAELDGRAMFSVDDVKKFFADTVLPLLDQTCSELEAVDAEIAEHDEDIDGLMNMAEGAEDMLQPETAGVFALVITACRELAKELASRLRPNNAGDEKWKKRVAQVNQFCQIAEDKLREITVEVEEDPEQPAPDAPQNNNEGETPNESEP